MTTPGKVIPALSVIVPISGRHDEVSALYREYKTAVEKSAQRFEFVFVLDGPYPKAFESLQNLQAEGEPIRIVQLAKWFGEATALMAGFEHSSNDTLALLPAHRQVEATKLHVALEALEECDVVVARRWPRVDSWINRVQTKIFNSLLSSLTGDRLQDIGCSVRVLRRKVTDEISLYGDQFRFLPQQASRLGFRLKEVDIPQSAEDDQPRVYSPGVYLRRLLDILTILFLAKFTKKPLRFFGLLGSCISAAGGIILLSMIIQRAAFGIALGDRPALFLVSLLIVLGVQLFALGLLGELVIFTHAKEIKEYTVEKVVGEHL